MQAFGKAFKRSGIGYCCGSGSHDWQRSLAGDSCPQLKHRLSAKQAPSQGAPSSGNIAHTGTHAIGSYAVGIAYILRLTSYRSSCRSMLEIFPVYGIVDWQPIDGIRNLLAPRIKSSGCGALDETVLIHLDMSRTVKATGGHLGCLSVCLSVCGRLISAARYSTCIIGSNHTKHAWSLCYY